MSCCGISNEFALRRNDERPVRRCAGAVDGSYPDPPPRDQGGERKQSPLVSMGVGGRGNESQAAVLPALVPRDGVSHGRASLTTHACVDGECLGPFPFAVILFGWALRKPPGRAVNFVRDAVFSLIYGLAQRPRIWLG